MITRKERSKEGKALREQVPRSSHGTWEPGPDRPDPIGLLQAQDVGRLEYLLPIKYGRMAASPFAFLRGSAAVMVADLASTPVTGLQVRLCGAFWGLLFGLIFFVPFLGMAVGSAMGALAGKCSTYGIGRIFVKSVGEQVTEGTSALFLMTSRAVVDGVSEAAKEKGWEFETISTNLTKEQERQLREDFGVA